MGLNVKALTSSFELVDPQADLLAERFYEQLFQDYPHREQLFVNADLIDQRKRLIQSLTVVVKSTKSPKELGSYLHELGARHDAIGVTEEDYPPVAGMLLSELAGDTWTDELESAWTDALNGVAELMLEGAQKAKELVTSTAKASSGARAVKKSVVCGRCLPIETKNKEIGCCHPEGERRVC